MYLNPKKVNSGGDLLSYHIFCGFYPFCKNISCRATDLLRPNIPCIIKKQWEIGIYISHKQQPSPIIFSLLLLSKENQHVMQTLASLSI